jgi:hypothetical protein
MTAKERNVLVGAAFVAALLFGWSLTHMSPEARSEFVRGSAKDLAVAGILFVVTRALWVLAGGAVAPGAVLALTIAGGVLAVSATGKAIAQLVANRDSDNAAVRDYGRQHCATHGGLAYLVGDKGGACKDGSLFTYYGNGG